MSRSSESPPTSFSSLPYDITLNILARISIIHRPTLSLVSKSFQSLFPSRELHATRTLIGKREKYTYICLNFPWNNIHKPRWFILAQKLGPMPCFPYEYPKDPTVISIDSKIYIIGGYLKGNKSKNVFLFDCRTCQWHILPELLVPRGKSAAGLIDGKIYVLGGCSVDENWGEIYDPKSQTWELLSPTILTPHVRVQEVMNFCSIVSPTNFCFVVDEKILCMSSGSTSLYWCGFEENDKWLEVKGLRGLWHSLDLISVANPSGGRRLTVWWKKEVVGKIQIMWCAEILLERRSREELYGTIEWCKFLYTFENSDYVSLLHSALVTC